MIEWSESDELIRESVREFIDKEVEPHRDGLESGELSPYPIARTLFSEFGLDVVAAEAIKTILDKERLKAAAIAAGEPKPEKRGELRVVWETSLVRSRWRPCWYQNWQASASVC